MPRFLSLLTTLFLKPLISTKVPMGRPSKTQVSNDTTSDEEEEDVAADNHQIEDDDEELQAVAQSASSDDDDNSPDEAAADDDDDNKQVIFNPNLCVFVCGVHRFRLVYCIFVFTFALNFFTAFLYFPFATPLDFAS